MSRAPYSLPKAKKPAIDLGNQTASDTALGWRYPNPKMKELYGTEAMGQTAENIYDLTSHIPPWIQDVFAFTLPTSGRLQLLISVASPRKIIPVSIPQRKG